MLTLIIFTAITVQHSISSYYPPLSIGRKPTNDLIINIPMLSRFGHAFIETSYGINSILPSDDVWQIRNDNTMHPCTPGTYYDLTSKQCFRLSKRNANDPDHNGCTISVVMVRFFILHVHSMSFDLIYKSFAQTAYCLG